MDTTRPYYLEADKTVIIKVSYDSSAGRHEFRAARLRFSLILPMPTRTESDYTMTDQSELKTWG